MPLDIISRDFSPGIATKTRISAENTAYMHIKEFFERVNKMRAALPYTTLGSENEAVPYLLSVLSLVILK